METICACLCSKWLPGETGVICDCLCGKGLLGAAGFICDCLCGTGMPEIGVVITICACLCGPGLPGETGVSTCLCGPGLPGETGVMGVVSRWALALPGAGRLFAPASGVEGVGAREKKAAEGLRDVSEAAGMPLTPPTASQGGWVGLSVIGIGCGSQGWAGLSVMGGPSRRAAPLGLSSAAASEGRPEAPGLRVTDRPSPAGDRPEPGLRVADSKPDAMACEKGA